MTSPLTPTVAVIIREYEKIAESKVGQASVLAVGILATDYNGTSVKTVVPQNAADGGNDVQMSARTHFIVITNNTATQVYYRIRKKGDTTSRPPTASHPTVPSGASVIEAVYPQAIINFGM